MRTRTVGMLACVVLSMVTGCAMFGGGKVDALLAASQEQAKRQAVTEAVLMELAKRGNGVVADTLSSMPDAGAVGWAKFRRCIRDADNKPLLDAAGNAQFEESEAIGKSDSGREFDAFTAAQLRLAGIAFDHKTGLINPNAQLEGLALNILGPGTGGSKLNVEWAKVWAGAPAAEKAAAADAVAKSLEARKGLIVDCITAGGVAAKGVLESVGKATPYGLGQAIVDVVAKVGGVAVPATVVEPFLSLPVEASATAPPNP